MKHTLLLILAFIAFWVSPPVHANHIVGGEITYECTSPGEYDVTITLFRDALGIGPPLGNETVTIYKQGSSVPFLNVPIGNNLVVETVEPDLSNICPESVPEVGIQQGTYEFSVSLPNDPDGYVIVLQRCCRNQGILNIADPSNYGATYYATIPPETDPDVCVNTSPVYVNYPPIIICNGATLVFDHSATDADADSIAYSICPPLLGGSNFNPQPVPATAPDWGLDPWTWAEVPWTGVYDADYQIPSEPEMVIDSITGQLILKPTALGLYVVGICATEFRDGEAINTLHRDFQFNITDCQLLTSGLSTNVNGETDTGGNLVINTFYDTDTIVGCAPMAVVFENASDGANEWIWEFGNGAPQEFQENPLGPVIYPTEGTFEAFMVATDTECNLTDTIFTVVQVNTAPELNPAMNVIYPDDCTSLIMSFENATTLAPGADPADYTYKWLLANGQTAPTEDVIDYAFNFGGTYDISLVVTGPPPCLARDTVTTTITIGGYDLIADFTDPVSACAPASVTLSAATPAQTNDWDFGDGSTDQGETVFYTYNTPGTYDITLLADDPLACNGGDTITKTINVYANPTADLSYEPIEIEIQNEIQFTNRGSSEADAVYAWDFGDGTTAATENAAHTYQAIGDYEVCLTITFLEGNCVDTYCETITATTFAAIEVPNAFTPNGDGFNDELFVKGKGVLTIDFSVYNRLGQQVFHTKDMTESWDGSYKGSLQENEIYVYTLSADLADGTTVNRQGNISLIR